MPQTPLFSIITICYNAAETIIPTLDSVKSQSFDNYEYIIQDGMSTDKTVEIIKQHDILNLNLVTERDKGIYDAMNRGLCRAKGEYVIFLNAGDAFHSSNTLKHIADLIEQEQHPGIVYGQTILVDKQRKYVGPRHLTAPVLLKYADFSEGMVVCHQAFVARRDITEPYNTRFRFSADYEWCLKCLRKSEHNVYAGEKPLIEYLNEGTTTKNRWKSLCERGQIMVSSYGLMPTLWKHIIFLIRAIKRKSL